MTFFIFSFYCSSAFNIGLIGVCAHHFIFAKVFHNKLTCGWNFGPNSRICFKKSSRNPIDCKSLNLTVKTHRTLLPPPVIVLLLCVLYIQFLCLLLLFLLSDIVRGLTLSTGSTTRETWAHSPEPSTSNSPQRAAQTRETCKTCSNTMTTLRFVCLKREEKQLASDSVTRIRISNGKIEITT